MAYWRDFKTIMMCLVLSNNRQRKEVYPHDRTVPAFLYDPKHSAPLSYKGRVSTEAELDVAAHFSTRDSTFLLRASGGLPPVCKPGE